MKKVSLAEAETIAKKLKLDLKVISLSEWRYGMQIEMEHGLCNKLTNVTNNDLLKTGKIALIHILEYPDYYRRLKKMEQDADKYWKGKKKINILTKSKRKKKGKTKK